MVLNDGKSIKACYVDSIGFAELPDFFKERKMDLKKETILDSDADFVVIAAPTNYDSHTQHFDTSAVEAVIKLVMEYNPNAIMVIKSTIPVQLSLSMSRL